MEPNRMPPQDNTARQPSVGMPPRPMRPTRLVSDFAPRTQSQPVTSQSNPSPRPVAQTVGPAPRPINVQSFEQPVTQPVQSQITPAPQPITQAPEIAPSPQADSPVLQDQLLSTPIDTPEHDTSNANHKEKNQTGHAGLVGFGVFILLVVLFSLPLLPGKTLDNFPGNSQSFSSGDQSLACLNAPTNITSKTTYDTKAGFPITYKYKNTTTQTATCDGSTQTVVAGRSSQFNPLGLSINIVTALVTSLIVSTVWRKIFGNKESARDRY